MLSKTREWLSYKWFSLVLYFSPKSADRYCERKGMRRAIGGRWGRWEVSLGGRMGTFFVWVASNCHHYPSPPFATSTEPLETEEYT